MSSEGFEAAERGLEHYYLAELHRLRAELLRLAGDAAGAERSFLEALDFARDQGARAFELRAATGLTRLLCASDRTDQGRALLSEAYAWFTEGLQTRDLVEARTLLDALS